VALINQFHGAESFLWANIRTASHKIPRLLWYPKVHYRVVHTSCNPDLDASGPHLHTQFLLRSILISSHIHVGFPSCLFPSGFPTKISRAFRISPMYATYPAHPFWHCCVATLLLFSLVFSLYNNICAPLDYFYFLNGPLLKRGN
jgi:hypothetical protein